MRRWPVWGTACGLLLVFVPGLRAEDKYFDSNGVKIRYTEQGKGEPVLLIHGFGASIEAQWEGPGILKGLAKDFRVIAYDSRGHGKSGKPHDPQKYGKELVEDAVRLLDHLKIKKAHVVGYSMGALIAAKLLVTHPDRLLTVTLGGAGAIPQEDRQAFAFADRLADSLEKGEGIGPLLDVLTPAGKPRMTAAQVKMVNQFFLKRNDAKALAALTRGWKALAVSDKQLKANRVPVLAIVGADDPLKKGVDELRGRLAGLKVVVIPNADHLTAFVRPEFLHALTAFLQEHRTGRLRAPSASYLRPSMRSSESDVW
jgi:pimeloyl-ACP methyl ester carboxylesterase